MSYEFYKLLHLLSLIATTSCLGIIFFARPVPRWARITSMVASLFLMIAGMGLLARAYPGLPWPLWAKAKIGIWCLISIGAPVMSKRMPRFNVLTFFLALALFMTAIFLVLNK